MGKRGPNKTPTKILANRGSNLVSARKNEVQPDVRLPAPPDEVVHNDLALREWHNRSAELLALGIIGTLDEAAFAIYCLNYAAFLEATEMMRIHGKTYTDERGHPRKSPWVSIANDAQTACLRAADKFGMAPTARANLACAIKEASSDGPSVPIKRPK